MTFCRDCICSDCENESNEDEEPRFSRGVCYQDCPDLIEASEQPRVYQYSAVPRWQFVDAAKDAGRQQLFMGAELEINFPREKEAQVLPIPRKYFFARHLWKYDRSVGQGAELVTAPHTALAWHSVNLKAMCDQMRSAGATSYKRGKCGFHIHASRAAIDSTQFARLKVFFEHHAEYLRLFAQRSEDQMHEWAHIPEPGGVWKQDHHHALCKTYQTIEFRIFRGTLFTRRLRASLQFVPAILLFCSLHSSMHFRSKAALKSFRSLAEKQGLKELVAEHDRAVARQSGNEEAY